MDMETWRHTEDRSAKESTSSPPYSVYKNSRHLADLERERERGNIKRAKIGPRRQEKI